MTSVATRWVRRFAVLALGLIILVQHVISGAVPTAGLCVHADGRLCIEAIAGTCCEPPAVSAICVDCDACDEDVAQPVVAAHAEARCDCTSVSLTVVPLHPSACTVPPTEPVLTIIDRLPWQARSAPITARTSLPSSAAMSLVNVNTVVLRC